MTRVTLDKEQAYRGELPPVCIRCGAKATDYRTKMFSLSPFGIPLFIIPFWVAIFPGRIWVRAPFCRAHRSHWTRRLLFISSGLVAAIVMQCGSFMILVDIDPTARDRTMVRVGLALFAGSVVAFLAWAATTIWLQRTGVRIVGRDYYTVTLAGVSEAFAAAVRANPPPRRRHGRRPATGMEGE